MRLFYNFIIFFIFFLNAQAGILLPKKINIQNGLSSNTVHKVFTDHSKITWVGTSAGTFMYKNGSVFPFIYKNSSPIQNCTDIIESKNLGLWFATNGLGIFNLHHNVLVNITEKQGLISNKVNVLYTKDDNVFVGTQNGISIYNKQTKQVLNPTFNHFKKYKEFNVLSFLEINGQVYFITQNDGTFKITNEENKPRIIKIRNHDYANSFCFWNNQIYLAEKNSVGVYSVFDYINNKPPHSNLLIDNVSDFAEEDSQLVAVSQKIYVYKGGIFLIQKDNSFKEYSTYQNLLSQSFNSVFIDKKQEVAFIGTENDGFLVFDLDNSKRYFSTNNLVVQDIQAFQNKILIVTDEDIQIRSAFGELIHKINSTEVYNLLKSKIKSSKKIQFLKSEIHDNHIYIKSNIGFLKFDAALKNLSLYTTQDQPLLLKNGQPFMFNPFLETNSESDFIGKLYTDHPNKLPHILLEAVSFGDDVVVSTKNYGLYVIRNTKTIPLATISDFAIDQIKHIQKNVNNKLLVVTYFNEIYELDPSNNYKVSFKFKDKRLKGKNIYFVDSYKDYHVIATDVGIEFLSDDKHLILGKDYGLYLSDHITASIIGNILYVGGNGGFYEFEIDQFLNYKNKVKAVKITSINTEVNEIKEEIDIDDIKNNTLYVKLNQAPLFIKIIPESDIDTESLLIRYKINPESGWSNFTSETSIQILSFLTDSYNIEVEVLDTISQESYTFDVLKIKVTKPYFYLKVFSALILLIVGSYFLITNYFYKKKNKELKNNIQNQEVLPVMEGTCNIESVLEDEVSLETKMLLNSINSHFIFNILNYYNYLILEVKTREALKYSGQFANFIRCLLKNGSVKFSSLENEIEFIKAYIELEKHRYNFSIDFKIEVDENIDITEVSLPSFILHPILETIINYSFNTNQNNESIVLKIIESDSEHLEIKYCYTGKSLEEINLEAPDRFNKGLMLLNDFNSNFTKQNVKLRFGFEDSVNCVYFKINA